MLLQRLKDLEGKQIQNALHVTETEAVVPNILSQQELIAPKETTPMIVKTNELKIEPINLSNLPVFGEYC